MGATAPTKASEPATDTATATGSTPPAAAAAAAAAVPVYPRPTVARDPPPVQLTADERAAIMADDDNFRYNFLMPDKGASRVLRDYPLRIYVCPATTNASSPPPPTGPPHGRMAYYHVRGSTSMLEVAKMVLADPLLEGGDATTATATATGPSSGPGSIRAELDAMERAARRRPGRASSSRLHERDIRFVFAGRALDPTRCFCAESGIQTDTTLRYFVRLRASAALPHVQCTVAELEAAAERDRQHHHHGRSTNSTSATADTADVDDARAAIVDDSRAAIVAALTRVLLDVEIVSGRAAAKHQAGAKPDASDGKTQRAVADDVFECATAPGTAAATTPRPLYAAPGAAAAPRSHAEWARLNAIRDNTQWYAAPAPRDAALVAAATDEAAAARPAGATGDRGAAAGAGAAGVPAAVLGKLTPYPLTVAFCVAGSRSGGVVATVQLNGVTSVGDVARAFAADPTLYGASRAGADDAAKDRYVAPPPQFFRFVFGGRVLPHDRVFCGEHGFQPGARQGTVQFAVGASFAAANAPYYAARAGDR